MAETNVPITPGIGTLIDGYTMPNGNFAQTVVPSDASGHTPPIDPVGGMTVTIANPQGTPSNKTRVVLSADAQASVAAEAMMTFQSERGGVVAAGLTSYTVTAGKTLRIVVASFKIRPSAPSTTVTFANTVFRFRLGNLITSPLSFSIPILMQTNVDSNPTNFPCDDGLEFAAGTVIGISHLASAATILESFTLIGYEY